MMRDVSLGQLLRPFTYGVYVSYAAWCTVWSRARLCGDFDEEGGVIRTHPRSLVLSSGFAAERKGSFARTNVSLQKRRYDDFTS